MFKTIQFKHVNHHHLFGFNCPRACILWMSYHSYIQYRYVALSLSISLNLIIHMSLCRRANMHIYFIKTRNVQLIDKLYSLIKHAFQCMKHTWKFNAMAIRTVVTFVHSHKRSNCCKWNWKIEQDRKNKNVSWMTMTTTTTTTTCYVWCGATCYSLLLI